MDMALTCRLCEGHKSLWREKDEYHPINYFKCDDCNAQSRHELVWQVYENDPFPIKKMLDISPVGCLRDRFVKVAGEYISTDHPPRQETTGVVMADMDMDLCNAPFEDKTFDFILIMHVLDFIPDERKAIEELHRILTDSGRVFLTIPIFDEPTRKLDGAILGREWAFGEDVYRRYDDIFQSTVITGPEPLIMLTK